VELIGRWSNHGGAGRTRLEGVDVSHEAHLPGTLGVVSDPTIQCHRLAQLATSSLANRGLMSAEWAWWLVVPGRQMTDASG
jgi:hypothetical protein